MTLRARLGGAAAAALLLIFPASSLGATIKVNPSHADGCSDGECKTIGQAIAGAKTDDVIEIMAGTYQESPVVDKKLELRGVGGDTKIVGSGSGDVVTLAADGAKLTTLVVQAPADAQSAIVLNGANARLLGVVAQRTGGTEPVIDVTKGPAAIEKSYVVQGSPTGLAAIRSSAAGNLSALGAVTLSAKGPALLLTAGTGNLVQGSQLATMDKAAYGVEVRSGASSATKKKLTINSSVVVGGADAAGVLGHTASGGLAAPSTAGSIDLVVRHATIYGGKGIIAHAEANHVVTDADHGDVKATVASSIVHGESRTFNYTSPLDLVFASNVASISFTTSNAPPAPNYPGVTRDGATGFTPAGQLFRSGSFALRADAADVIDRGGVVDAAELQVDIDGEARAVDGNADGNVVSDIGADEFVNKAPAGRFAATNVIPKQNELVGFISTAADPEAAFGGGIKEYRWDFGDGHKETTTVHAVGHTFTQRGVYKVTLTTVDKQGAVAVAEPVMVAVRDGVAPQVSIGTPESDATYRLNPLRRKGSRRPAAPRPLTAVGMAADDDKVAKVEVALTLTKRDPKPKSRKRKRARRSAATCEQFRGMSFVKQDCERLIWIEVSAIGGTWSFETPSRMRIPAGRYQMRVRAVDAQGNVTGTPKVSDKTLVGFRVK